MGKSNITLPPLKKSTLAAPAVADEKKISEVINKGGSTTKESDKTCDIVKNFNVKLLSSELDAINKIRDQMLKPRGKRMAITLHDWIIEAIQEKLERQSRKYDT